jgi:hypothetical protein
MRRFDVARKRNSDPNSDSQGRPKHNFQHSRPFFDRRRREWDSDRGLRLKDSDEIDPENIGAVAEIEESRVVDKKGHDVVTIKIKQHSRHQALKDLAKIFKMEVERQEISGPDGGPIGGDGLSGSDHRALERHRQANGPDNDGSWGSA